MKQIKKAMFKDDLNKFFIMTFLFLSFSLANAVSVNEVKISLDLKHTPISKVFNQIEMLTAYKFFYKNEDINLKKEISIKVNNQPISLVLKMLLKKEDLTFKIIENQIIIKNSVLNRSNNHQIQGEIIDASTGETIPFCSIIIGATYSGTSSNEEGEFVIDLEALPSDLIFSHLSYEKQSVTVSSESSDLLIRLVPLVRALSEVTLSDGIDRVALKLAKAAFKKTKKTSNIKKFGRALYRQKSKNDDDYSELLEAIYDIRYSNSGIEDWDILEGRYALKKGRVNNKNYTLFSRLLKSIQPDTDDLIFPLHSELEKFYNVRIINRIQSEEGEIAVLWFKPLKSVSTPIFEGEVYINIITQDVLKVIGSIAQDDFKLIKLTEKDANKKNYELSYEISFKKDTILDLAIDYIKVNQGFDYYKGDSFQTRVSSVSNLSFFEYYTPTIRKKLGRQFRRSYSDWENLNEIGYNKRFWDDNAIVKRTPVEEEVIASFEKENVFGSIFLNSRDQVALLQTNIAGDPFIKSLSNDLRVYNNDNPIEKVSLHTDKDIVSSGEDLWYSAYCVLGTSYNYSLASKVLYVDLINSNNEIVLSQTQELIEGRGAGSMEIPEGLSSGTYLLRAYTNWMRNYDSDFFFTKRIYVIDGDEVNTKALTEVEEEIDVQFFPEGGECVQGLSGQIAFRAIGADGMGKDVKGKVFNSKGGIVAFVNTIDNGSGFFNLTPKPEETYFLELIEGSKYPLPKAKTIGYNLTVKNTNSRSIIVKVQASEELRNKKFYIIGSIQNKKYFQGSFKFSNTTMVNFEIPKSKLPSGVMTLTLFDENKKPWSERVLFINNEEELVINARINKNRLRIREKIQIDIDVTNTDGVPISTDLSVSITDEGKVKKDVNSNNILTHLLLESDIKGEIENPNSYFIDQQRSTRSKLDLVMLTHGWRRFNWKDNGDSLSESFAFENNLKIKGIAKYSDGNLLRNRDIKVIAKSESDLKMYPIRTDELGRFSIDNLNHSKSTELVFNAYNSGGKPIDVKILLDEREEEGVSSRLNLKNYKVIDNFSEVKDREEIIDYVKATVLRRETDSLYDLEYDFSKVTRLDEVLLEGQGSKKDINAAPSVYNLKPDATVYAKDYNGNQDVTTLLNTVSGVDAGAEQVFIRGAQFSSFAIIDSEGGTVVSRIEKTSPLWVLDGIQLPTEISRDVNFQLTNIPNVIKNLTVLEIERIEVLKTSRAGANFGTRGANGVILVYTKRGGSVYNETVSPNFTINGYSDSKEFYSPKYDVKLPEHAKPDYRTTLYWNPSITTDKNGKASIVFYNTDITKSIQLDIQGLSIYGLPGAYLKTFGKE